MLKAILICTALVMIDMTQHARAAECFPRNSFLLPKVNRKASVTDYIEKFEAVVGTDDFIIYGGTAIGTSISTLDSDDGDDHRNIISRMDLK